MRIFFILLLACILYANAAFGNTSFSKTTVGMQTYGLVNPETGEHMSVAVWFPSPYVKSGVTLDGAVIPAHMSKKVAPGFYPIILISHDSAGGRFVHNDLAVYLAGKGNIVVAPTHIGDSVSNSKNIYSAELLYSRPRDLLLALEQILSVKELAPYADESRIGVVGVGFGAITAMQLVGGMPDISLLKGFCEQRPSDSMCLPWVSQQWNKGLPTLEGHIKDLGLQALCPPLWLYAPDIVEVDMSYFDEDEQVVEKAAPKSGMKDFVLGVIGKNKDEDPVDADEDDGLPSFPDGIPEDFIIQQDFQKVGVYGAVGKENKVLITPGPVDSYFGEKIATKELAVVATMHKFKGRKKEFVFHRKPEVRRILAAVLVAPAGGMLFTQISLADVDVPVGIVYLRNDELYSSVAHTEPFFTSLPVPPEVLTLEHVDHYSVFAPCSNEAEYLLDQACGRLDGDLRMSVQKQRDAFTGNFFKAALGGVLPVPPESGFIDSTAFGVNLR